MVRVTPVSADDISSNLYALGAQDKVVQRILRHSKPHVTRERYIKVFDRTVLEAVEKVQARIEELRPAKVGSQQLQLKFGDHDNLRTTNVAESRTGRGFSHFSTVRPTVGHHSISSSVVSC